MIAEPDLGDKPKVKMEKRYEYEGIQAANRVLVAGGQRINTTVHCMPEGTSLTLKCKRIRLCFGIGGCNTD